MTARVASCLTTQDVSDIHASTGTTYSFATGSITFWPPSATPAMTCSATSRAPEDSSCRNGAAASITWRSAPLPLPCAHMPCVISTTVCRTVISWCTKRRGSSLSSCSRPAPSPTSSCKACTPAMIPIHSRPGSSDSSVFSGTAVLTCFVCPRDVLRDVFVLRADVVVLLRAACFFFSSAADTPSINLIMSVTVAGSSGAKCASTCAAASRT
mmetsp:Transcript_26945/g.43232  ORF Transcript_26945/g.43232 Transcript_26945/m.43232 type:complete len:212 (-) Transcript_26945:768-1403(-)